ncbi:MAG: HAD family hydrolase [Actinomycetota bacterium]
MPIDAVIFDLYGTVVDEFPKSAFHEALTAMADILGAEREAFLDEWSATAIERQTGRMGDIDENLRVICSRLGLRPGPKASSDALEVRAEMYRQHFRPKDQAEASLAALKVRGLPMGLISMCAPDTPALWRASVLAPYIDVEVFSCETGLRKPDAEIYRYATERLGVSSDGTLYVGDGAYSELTGATAFGMTAVLIRDPNDHDALRPEAEDWSGASIVSLTEVLSLV